MALLDYLLVTFFPISKKKILTREFLIIDVNMHKLRISIFVNTVSYATVCIYKATDKQTLASPWDLLARVPWDKVLEGREVQEN